MGLSVRRLRTVALVVPALCFVLNVCSTDSAVAKATSPATSQPSSCRPGTGSEYPRPSVVGIRATYRSRVSERDARKATVAFSTGVHLCVWSVAFGQHSMTLSVQKRTTVDQIETVALQMRRISDFSHVDVVLRSS